MQNAESSPARGVADKIRAARDVLEAVQRFRYDNEHPALREAMRQTALAALESARVDAVDAGQRARFGVAVPKQGKGV